MSKPRPTPYFVLKEAFGFGFEPHYKSPDYRKQCALIEEIMSYPQHADKSVEELANLYLIAKVALRIAPKAAAHDDTTYNADEVLNEALKDC